MQCALHKPAKSLLPSPLLVAFVERQVRCAELYSGPERRGEVRHPFVLPVVVQPIDEEFRAIGQPLAMVTRDMSTRGFCLVHEDRLAYEWIALRLPMGDDDSVLVGEVRWRKPAGPFYSFGCEVIARLDTFPEQASRELQSVHR